MRTFVALGALLPSAQAANVSSSSAALLSSGNLDLGVYDAAYNKATAFVSKLSNAQKVSIITGSSVTNGSNGTSWTAYANKDGFAGINEQYFVSAFAMGQALGMTWDREHMQNEARASGREFYLEGFNLINGPLSGALGRTPYGGRSGEGFTPDPYLNGIATANTIKGMSTSCLKFTVTMQLIRSRLCRRRYRWTPLLAERYDISH